MAADDLARRGDKSLPPALPSDDDAAAKPEEDDVEGHSMLPNAFISRSLAQARERDVQQNLKRHDRELEARDRKRGR